MDFVAIDVETANECPSSICQIGMARFENGEIKETWVQLINPKAEFSAMNISIHGITPKDVKNSPTFLDIADELKQKSQGQLLASYGAFDRFAIQKATAKNNLLFSADWFDIIRAVRRYWPDCAQKGYGLAKIAKKLKFDFEHHHALADAIAAGKVLSHILSESGQDIAWWQSRVKKPMAWQEGQRVNSVATAGDTEGPFYGEAITFTGALAVPRAEAAKIASQAGFDVLDGVNKKTTFLVVGEQDLQRLAGQEKSAKHRKAESLIEKGQDIKIIEEKDFFNMVSCCAAY